VDPRKTGSKNIGATNIFRTAGKALGILTLVGDVLKGVIPTVIAMHLVPADQWGLSRHVWIALAGLSPFLGHIFSIFLGFKGGKGVATALGVYLPISTISVLIEFLIFAGIVWKWRYISLGSITCAITISILIAFFRSDSQAYFIVSVIIAALILYRHQSNISRLLQGTESKWKA
jgi:glycerol-3-phosphate acyltransferase PlsY